jgi:hypothetical protein
MIHGRVYKIYCNETGECYYGSTEQTLSRRLSKHKQNCKSWKKGKAHYVYSFRIIERGNFTISLLEENDFENKDFMKARERHYIENFECVNKVVPNRTDKEYREANRQQREEYNKKYYEANREQKLEYHKEYREANKEHIAEQNKQKYTCDCGGKYTHINKTRHFKSKKHLAYLSK